MSMKVGRAQGEGRSLAGRPTESGLTLVELMIGLLLSSIAIAFAFSIYAKSAAAYRDQRLVSEAQQNLVAVSGLLTSELRRAGFLVTVSFRAAPAGLVDMRALSINNNSEIEGSDVIRIAYADTSQNTRLSQTPTPCPVTSSQGVTDGGFGAGDLVFAVRLDEPFLGQACVLSISAVTPVGAEFRFGHAPDGRFNVANNPQCDSLCGTGDWFDGNTVMSRAVLRAYRILPGDPRGVFQVSPSGGMIANDWQDVALGIVDVQFALQLFQAGDLVDEDGDGDPQLDWFAGDNMETAVGDVNLVRVNVLGRSLKNTTGPTIARTPDFCDQANMTNNDQGDRCGIDLPGTDANTRYGDQYIYRWVSTLVNVRNL